MKLQLKDKQIPKRVDGYPDFTRLGVGPDDPLTKPTHLFNQFTEEEIVELCNRALYQLDYQKTSHQKYQQRQREWEAPVKAKIKELYPGTSWIKATPEQLEAAVKAAYPTSQDQFLYRANTREE